MRHDVITAIGTARYARSTEEAFQTILPCIGLPVATGGCALPAPDAALAPGAGDVPTFLSSASAATGRVSSGFIRFFWDQRLVASRTL